MKAHHRFRWPSDSLGRSDLIKRIQHVFFLKIPYFQSSILGDQTKQSGAIGTPISIHDFCFNVQAFEGMQCLVLMPIPELATPISRAAQENVGPKGIATDFIDRPGVSKVAFEILLGIALAALMDGALLGGNQVHVGFASDEIERKPGRCSEVHSLLH